MATLKTLLAGGLAAASLAYIGTKTYIYFGVKNELDDMISRAARIAGISYDSVSSSLDGSISIDGIKIRPVNIDDTINIERMRFITPGYRFLLNGIKDMQSSGKLPKTMGFEVSHVMLSVYGDILDTLEDAAYETGTIMDGCSSWGNLTSDEYAALGMDSLDMSFSATYQFYEREPGIMVHADFNLHGIQSGELEYTLADLTRDPASFTSRKVLLKNFTLTLQDNADFRLRANEYCAEQYEMPVAEYLDKVLTAQDSFISLFGDAVPNQAIRTAFAQYASNPVSLRISGYPVQPIDLRTIHLYAAKDISDLLGLGLSVNGKVVENVGFTKAVAVRDIAEYSESDSSDNSIQAFIASSEQASQSDETEGTQISLRKIRIQELRAHIGERIRLTTHNNKTRTGFIKSISNNSVLLEQHVYGGSMSSQIQLTDIKRAELLH